MFSTPNTRVTITRGIASFAALVMVYSFAGSTQVGAQARVIRPGSGRPVRPVPNNPNLNGSRTPYRQVPNNSNRNTNMTFQNGNGTYQYNNGTMRQIPNHPNFPNRTTRRP